MNLIPVLQKVHRRFPTQYSDTFARADGALGRRWIAPTWAIVSGVAVATPVLGAEAIVNGDMELDANWANVASPTTNVHSNEQAHNGTYSRKVVANEASEGVGQNLTLVIGQWYSAQVWIYGDGTHRIVPRMKDGTAYVNFNGVASIGVIVPAAWTAYQLTFRATGTDGRLQVITGGAETAGTFYVDDVTLKPVTLVSTLAAIRFARPNLDVSAAVTRAVGTHSGVYACVNNPLTGANGVFSYLDGQGSVKTDKLVNGVWTNIPGASGAVTYGAGKVLHLKQLGGTTFSVTYDGVAVGAPQTISDASVIRNTYCGLFSMYSGNSLDSFDARPAS